jgi:heptaprenyl diphosphate synthase
VTTPFGLESLDGALEADLRSGLDRVEVRLREAVKSQDSFVAEAASYLVEAGGKRFRPLLTLLGAQFGDPHRAEVIDAAAVVEITHLATLYHDDVMDEAPLRRGAASANSRWDNSVAILTGDFLFARASQILADLGPDAVRIQALTFEELVSGQIRETIGPREGEDPIHHYLEVVAEKTGSLIATSGLFGAIFSGAPVPIQEAMRAFGASIGIAFQLSDDVLDVASESSESGKTPGTDLREGVLTLPVLQALAIDDADAREIGRLIGPDLAQVSEAEVDQRVEQALVMLRQHEGMNLARAELSRCAVSARELLVPLPDCAAKEALAALTDVVVSRSV